MNDAAVITPFPTGPKQSFSLAPRDINEAMRLAEMLSDSELVPKDFRGNPANVLVAVQWGAEIGLQPMQAMQNIAVINGRPSLWGDAVWALIKAHPLCEYTKEEFDDSTMTATCTVKRRGNPDPTVSVFTQKDAEKAGLWTKDGAWKNYPKRMLKMRARAFACRDAIPEALKGIGIAEEAMDIPERDITPAGAPFDGGAALNKPGIWTNADFDKNFPKWKEVIESKRKTHDELIAFGTQKFAFTDEQEKKIRAIVIPGDAVTTASAEQLEDIIAKAAAATISMEEIGKRFSLAQGSLIPASLVPDILSFIRNPMGE